MSGDWLADYFAKMMPGGVEEWAAQFDAEPVVARRVVMPGDDWRRANPALGQVVKLSGYVEIADELLNPQPSPPPSWQTRLRYRITHWRERLACRAYRLIAGYWPDNGEDY